MNELLGMLAFVGGWTLVVAVCAIGIYIGWRLLLHAIGAITKTISANANSRSPK